MEIEILFNTFIENNPYVSESKSNKKRDISSLSFLIRPPLVLSQSDCIKLGIGLEKVTSDFILGMNNTLNNIKQKNEKMKKERDHLFQNETTKTIYYAELKSNLNLDTEKCKATSKKCEDIKNELIEEFPGYTVVMSLVGLRYHSRSEIPTTVMRKYQSIEADVLGINEYLQRLDINSLFETEEEYKNVINHLATNMFST